MESELRSPMPRRRAHLHTPAKDPQVSKANQQREEGMRARKSSGGHRSKPCNSRVRVRVSAERAREGTERGSRSETGSKTRGWRREWKARGRKGGRDTYLGGGGGRAPGAPLSSQRSDAMACCSGITTRGGNQRSTVRPPRSAALGNCSGGSL
jgi:hypothetical protein